MKADILDRVILVLIGVITALIFALAMQFYAYVRVGDRNDAFVCKETGGIPVYGILWYAGCDKNEKWQAGNAK